MPASGGEADFALAIVCRLWRGLRSLLRQPLLGSSPPFATFRPGHPRYPLTTAELLSIRATLVKISL
jgi:hypothetical protein